MFSSTVTMWWTPDMWDHVVPGNGMLGRMCGEGSGLEKKVSAKGLQVT